jgi:hypothetical protein
VIAVVGIPVMAPVESMPSPGGNTAAEYEYGGVPPTVNPLSDVE